MAVMSCPHCGKELYDGLLECPHCYGPVAFIKMMAKKPLVSKEKVLKELAKKTD